MGKITHGRSPGRGAAQWSLMVGALWSGILMAAGCQTLGQMIQKPDLRFNRMEISDMSFLGGTLLFYFDVENPNPLVEASLDQASYRLMVNGRLMAEGIMDQGVRIGPDAVETVKVPVTIQYLDVFKSLTDLAGKDEVPYEISGTFSILGFGLPYQVSGKLPVPRPPSISLQSVKFSKLSTTGATADFKVAIKNPNPFGMPIDGLEYGIDLNGIRLASGKTGGRTVISKNHVTIIHIPAQINFKDVGKGVHQLLSGRSAGYEMKGNVVFDLPGAGKKFYPFTRRGEVSLRK